LGGPSLPTDYALHQNYPNPFNPSTEISFDVPAASHVTLSVYNVLGQSVTTLVDREMAAGRYSASWDGTSDSGVKTASGIYFYKLIAGDFTETKKMVMLK
ncbi:MAG TPA: T9SS type A sorting domain-containing protein, partial [Candidatus Deferrimicrobium sp.]|nr:T9SS type A sorting domain-containing protein [Candidatus Deferrimicrobium sp.]